MAQLGQPMSESEKLIMRMRKSYQSARRTLKKSLEKCSVGTSAYLQHIKAMAELDAKEREEEISLGLTPQNLGAVSKPEFVFVSHIQVVPGTKKELEKLLSQQMQKACEGLYLSDDDERIRKELEEQYGADTRSEGNGSTEHDEQ